MQSSTGPLPLRALNHVSRMCSDVGKSREFYRDVLGFYEIKRPSFDFEGSWLFGFGIGVHLIAGQPVARPKHLKSTRDDHLSFLCESLTEVEKRLRERKIEYLVDTVVEGGVKVQQIFFLDPDGNMIEICNCDCIPIIPLPSSSPVAAQPALTAAPPPALPELAPPPLSTSKLLRSCSSSSVSTLEQAATSGLA